VKRFRIKVIFQELRRRRVFNTVAIYVAGAWIALQVAEQAFPALDIPDRAIRYVWLGAFLLFPLVLVFGWRYDISREGVRRTAARDAAGEAGSSLKRPDKWFIGSLTVVALAVIASMLLEISRVEPTDEVVVVAQENSIAVMPFGVCEERPSDAPLAGGLTGEVISNLAGRDRLKVIGRATAFNLASFGSSTQEVAELTKTQYVLTGALCRDGFDLRLDAEMTDADGFIVWRESFTEVTNQFDQVEERLARLVASGVARELGDVIGGASDAPVNRLALEQLLIGQEYWRQNDAEKARTAFEQALEHQPDMAEAVWALTLMEVNEDDDGDDRSVSSRLEQAWPLGQRALDLALAELERGVPDFKAHWIAGQILHTLARWDEVRIYHAAAELSEEEVAARKQAAKRQFLEAEQHLRSALVLNPSASEVRGWLSTNLRRQGVHRSAEALEIMEEGWSYDPFNVQFSGALANQLAARGQYRQAMEVLDRFEALPHGKRGLYRTQLEIMNNYARYDDKLATLIEIFETDPEGSASWGVIGHLWWTVPEIVTLNLKDEAEVLYGQVEHIGVPWFDPKAAAFMAWGRELFLVDSYQWAVGNRDEVIEKRMAKIAGMSNEEILDDWHVRAKNNAAYLWVAGQRERAIELAQAVRHATWGPFHAERQYSWTVYLAGMYIEVGRADDATPLLAEAVANLEEAYAAGIRHPETLITLASAYGLQGNNDEALVMMERAVDYGWWITLVEMEAWTQHILQIDLWWQQLQDDPRFTHSVNRMRAIRDQQADNVRSLLTQYDMDELLAPVIEEMDRKAQELGH